MVAKKKDPQKQRQKALRNAIAETVLEYRDQLLGGVAGSEQPILLWSELAELLADFQEEDQHATP